MEEIRAENQPEVARSRKKWWVIGIVIAVVWLSIAWGLVSLWSDFWNTMGSIVPGSRDRLSTSMEPIDLSLKSNIRGRKYLPEGAEPIEWDLRLPRAFVRLEIGSNDNILGTGKNNCCEHFVHFYAVYDEQSGALTPATLSTPEQRRDMGMDISIDNHQARSELVPEENCIRTDDLVAFVRRRNGIINDDRSCPKGSVFCSIYSHVDGWNTEYRVPIKLYEQAGKVCSASRKFLDQYTVKRDVRY